MLILLSSSLSFAKEDSLNLTYTEPVALGVCKNETIKVSLPQLKITSFKNVILTNREAFEITESPDNRSVTLKAKSKYGNGYLLLTKKDDEKTYIVNLNVAPCVESSNNRVVYLKEPVKSTPLVKPPITTAKKK